MNALATRLRCTEGQLYTAALGLGLALALLVIGIPPALRDSVEAAASAPLAASPSPSATTTTTTAPTTTMTAPSNPSPRPVPPLPPTTVPATTRTSAPPTVAPPPPGEIPLSIVDAGYTSSTGGTPLAGPDVPDDGMPVGVRLGQVDKVSFARLAGSARVLRLRLVDDPAASRLVAFAAVQACVITEVGWALAEPGAPPDQAPAYDPDRCVDAAPGPDGVWSFDLGELDAFDVGTGVAFVPVFEGPATFQVTFSVVAVTAANPTNPTSRSERCPDCTR